MVELYIYLGHLSNNGFSISLSFRKIIIGHSLIEVPIFNCLE